MLKIFKRDLFLCAAITAAVILCALAWGSPFFGSFSYPGAVRAQSAQVHSMVFQGALFRDRGQTFFRDTSGAVFHFDNPESANAFVGRTVTINGSLEASSMTIHIMRIEPTA